MAVIYKCDKCGTIIENIRSGRKYQISEVYTDPIRSQFPIDLCDDCYNKFLEF